MKIHLVAIWNILQIIFHVELRAACSASLSRSPNSVLRCVANMWRMVESFSAVKQVNIYVHIYTYIYSYIDMYIYIYCI